MASSTVGIGLTIGAVAQGSVGAVLASTRRGLEGLTRSSRALGLAQQKIGRQMRPLLASQQAHYDRLGRALGRVRLAHDQLTTAAARSNAALAAGKQSWGQLAGTAMAAWGTIKGVMATAGQAAAFADTLRETRIKGGLSAEQETALGDAIRVNVSTTNQSRDDLALGAHQLITGGSSVEEVQSQLGLMGTTMTALRTSSEQTTGAMLALRDMGLGDREGVQGGIERLIAIGQRGQFTPDMMVQAFAQLGDVIKTTGLKGDTAIAELAAGLQIAEGSMGAAGAQAGLQSWLTSMRDPKLAAAYKNAGVDYQTSMADMQKAGLSEYQASLKLAGAFIRDSLNAKDQQALLQGDDDGRIASMLSELGLGEVFKDANAARFALSIHNNRDAYQDMTGASGEGSLAALKTLRDESPVEQMKALKNNVNALAMDIGTALLPALLSVTNTLTPFVAGLADFARAHPGVVSAIGTIAAGVVGMRVATVAGTFAWRQIMIVWTQGAKAFQLLRTGLVLAQAKMALLRSGTLLARGALMTKLGAVRVLAGSLMGRLTTGLRTASTAALGFGRSLLVSARGAMATTGSAVGGLARTLGGALLSGLRIATKAVWGLGRAMLMNPIGIAVTAIAGAAYLIYKYWEPISGFFARLWEGVKVAFSAAWTAISGVFSGIWDTITTAFDGGIAGISELIVNWSPLGLFYKAFAGVMDWFGVDLPDSFSGFGRMLIDGLIGGITGTIGKVKDAIVGIGESVTGWFRDTLGINSPSRVFMALGSGIPEGAAKGITGAQGLVRQAALGMATATAVTLAAPVISAPVMPELAVPALAVPAIAAPALPEIPPVPPRLVQAGPAGGRDGSPNLVIHFSPTIHVQAADASGVAPVLDKGLNAAKDDLRREVVRIVRDEQLRAQRSHYGIIGDA